MMIGLAAQSQAFSFDMYVVSMSLVKELTGQVSLICGLDVLG
jgi:hypothetical protein